MQLCLGSSWWPSMMTDEDFGGWSIFKPSLNICAGASHQVKLLLHPLESYHKLWQMIILADGQFLNQVKVLKSVQVHLTKSSFFSLSHPLESYHQWWQMMVQIIYSHLHIQNDYSHQNQDYLQIPPVCRLFTAFIIFQIIIHIKIV